MRAAIAHDWFAIYGGSERCVEELLKAFPGSRVVTALVNRDGLPPAFSHAEPSILQRIPGATKHHEWLVPLMPLAWRSRQPLRDVDVVLASSHACAHAVRAASGTPVVVYCHTPMRYAWDFDAEAERFPSLLRPVGRRAMALFRAWDRSVARRPATFVANSSAVARRIQRFYGRSAVVVHPPVRTDYFTEAPIEREDFFLYVGRLTGYKQPRLVMEAFRGTPYRLVVVGEGVQMLELRQLAPSNVTLLGSVADDVLRDLYRRTKAFVYPIDEDFGIAMAEAQACGAPVIGLARGGALDIVDDGKTGWLIEEQSIGAVRSGLRVAAAETLDSQYIAAAAQRFAAPRFRNAMRGIASEAVSVQSAVGVRRIASTRS